MVTQLIQNTFNIVFYFNFNVFILDLFIKYLFSGCKCLCQRFMNTEVRLKIGFFIFPNSLLNINQLLQISLFFASWVSYLADCLLRICQRYYRFVDRSRFINQSPHYWLIIKLKLLIKVIRILYFKQEAHAVYSINLLTTLQSTQPCQFNPKQASQQIASLTVKYLASFQNCSRPYEFLIILYSRSSASLQKTQQSYPQCHIRQCIIDSHCGPYQICKDDGLCHCRDQLCNGANTGLVCNFQNQDGICVECRQGASQNCGQFRGCNQNNKCACVSQFCPQYTVCNQQDQEDGQCNIIVFCKSNADCPSKTHFCQDIDNDDKNVTRTPFQRFSDNLCRCNQTLCSSNNYSYRDEAGANQIVQFNCIASFDIESTSTQVCVAANCDLTPGSKGQCPGSYSCISNTVGDQTYCVRNDIKCRTENGQFTRFCYRQTYLETFCPSQTFNDLQIAPFCTPSCNQFQQYCQGYVCPQGFSAQLVGESEQSELQYGQCIFQWNSQSNMLQKSYCACFANQ